MFLKVLFLFVHNDKRFKLKFTKKYIYYNNPTDGQETKSLGMEQGVRKLHGRNKPALKHSGVCEEKQGTPSQSSKSGTPPSLGGGMRGSSEDCTGRTRTAAARKAFMPRLPPQSGTRSKMLYRQPQLQPGTALRNGTPALQQLTQQGSAWQRRGNVPGDAGAA